MTQNVKKQSLTIVSESYEFTSLSAQHFWSFDLFVNRP
jgi:hypothetical protein